MTVTEAPLQEFAPASPAELSRFVRDNAAGEKLSLYPAGGRTALQWLGPKDRPGTLVSLARLTRVIDYPARDMTITVEAGIRIEDLEHTLRAEGQQLPIDVSHRHRATLGGAIACNVSGPRRFGFGTFRDYLIGISAVDSEGRAFKAGGRVVKNVAGYDLCKLLVGSRGTLAIISQVTLKVKPLSEAVDSLWCSCASFSQIDEILEQLLTSETRPTAVEVLTPRAARDLVADARVSFPDGRPVLVVAFEGTEVEVHWQIGQLRRELAPYHLPALEETGSEWTRHLLDTLREYPDGGDVSLTFQANLLPSRLMPFLEACRDADISAAAHAGNGIVVGHLPDALTKDDGLQLLRNLTDNAREYGGNLLVLQADPLWRNDVEWWGRPEPSWPLMRKVKNALDPLGLMNPGGIPF